MVEHEPAEDVPATLRRLWGRDHTPRRGPKPALSVPRIVRAAVDLADAEGLAAVSMARVAEALGYSSMALYRHVSSKDELLMLMADAVAGELELPAYDEDWRSGLEAWTRAQIEGITARPWFIELPLTTAMPGPHRLRWIEHAFAIMRDLDITADEKLQIIGLLAQYVLGEGRVQVETRRAAAAAVRRQAGLPDDTPESALDPGAMEAANMYHEFETVLLRLADAESYPHLFAALAGDSAPARDGGGDELGLQIVLDGIAEFVAARTAARADAAGEPHDPFAQAAWDERYRSKPAIWSGRPNPQLVTEATGLSPGRALDVGCGEGADAIWLAEQGWQVTALDISTVALDRAAARAAAAGAEVAARITWTHADVREDAPTPRAYDLVSSQFMQLPPEPRGKLFASLAAAVAPGGILLVVGHDPSDLATTAHRPRAPEVFYSSQEVAASLDPAGWQVLAAETRPRTIVDDHRREVIVHDAVLVARRRGQAGT